MKNRGTWARLCAWEELPDNMRKPEVREYYDALQKKQGQLYLKRAFDLVASVCMVVILSPVLLILALWIYLDSEGPVFYRQERITQYGRTFRIYKFRTMVQNADKIGALVTTSGDSRVTKSGKFLRKCRLDELPQLFNIISGDMTIVGTRPEVKKYVDAYTEEMLATLLLPAGVTSLASIMYKDEATLLDSSEDVDKVYIEQVLPGKMKYNLEAIQTFSFVGEIGLMFRTVLEVLK